MKKTKKYLVIALSLSLCMHGLVFYALKKEPHADIQETQIPLPSVNLLGHASTLAEAHILMRDPSPLILPTPYNHASELSQPKGFDWDTKLRSKSNPKLMLQHTHYFKPKEASRDAFADNLEHFSKKALPVSFFHKDMNLPPKPAGSTKNALPKLYLYPEYAPEKSPYEVTDKIGASALLNTNRSTEFSSTKAPILIAIQAETLDRGLTFITGNPSLSKQKQKQLYQLLKQQGIPEGLYRVEQ